MYINSIIYTITLHIESNALNMQNRCRLFGLHVD